MTGDPPSNTGLSQPESSSACCMQQAGLTASTIPILVYDEETILYSNPVMDSLLTGPRGGSLIGHARSQFVAPDIAEAARDRIRLMTENEAVFDDLLIKTRRLDGSTAYAKAWCAGVQYEKGWVIALVMSFADGNEHLDPQILIGHRPSRARYPLPRCVHTAVFDALPVPMVIYDETHLVSVNQRACQLLGSDKALEGAPVTSFRHRDVAEAAEARREYVFNNRNAVHGMSGKYARLDGSVVRATGDSIPFDFEGRQYAIYSAKSIRL